MAIREMLTHIRITKERNSSKSPTEKKGRYNWLWCIYSTIARRTSTLLFSGPAHDTNGLMHRRRLRCVLFRDGRVRGGHRVIFGIFFLLALFEGVCPA